VIALAQEILLLPEGEGIGLYLQVNEDMIVWNRQQARIHDGVVQARLEEEDADMLRVAGKGQHGWRQGRLQISNLGTSAEGASMVIGRAALTAAISEDLPALG